MKMKTIAMLFGAAFLTFGAVSCDSREEQIREDALENQADAKEVAADVVREAGEQAADAQENKADAVRDSAEQKADTLEEAADRTRENQ